MEYATIYIGLATAFGMRVQTVGYQFGHKGGKETDPQKSNHNGEHF